MTMCKGLALLIGIVLLTACANGGHYAPVRDATVGGSLTSSNRTSVQQQEGMHVVQPGETLYSIAWRYQRDFRELAAINNIPEPYLIQPGQTIQLENNGVQTSPVIVPESELIGEQPIVVAPPSENVEPAPVLAPASAPPPAATTQPTAETVITPSSVPLQTQPVQETASIEPAPAETSIVVAVSPAAGKSKWIWPAQGKVIRGFSQKNKGLDIQGKENSPIFATAAGQVVYSGTGLRGYGQLVIIKHNADYLSAYAHNNKILVTEGQQVNQGQQIADMGDTGTNTVKLHFELRYKGKPVDPAKYLPPR